jgi:hypothetical protein
MTQLSSNDPFDRALAAMLKARADRAGASNIDVAMISIAPQRRPRRWHWPTALARGLVAAAASVAFVLLVVSLGPLRSRPAASIGPSASGLPPSASSEAAPSSTSAVPTAGFWPGGMPRSINGEPVLVGLEAQMQVAATTDDRSFLIGSPWHSGPLICSHPIVRDPDPNPLAVVGCPLYDFEGVPRPVLLPRDLVDGPGGPAVLRVHRNDPGAATCRNPAPCRQVLVVEALAWSADDGDRPTPIDVPDAITSVLGIPFADIRHPQPNLNLAVDVDTFALPIVCPEPAPPLAYALRGDPRLGLLFVFANAAKRQAFESSTEPAHSAACLEDPFKRPDRPQWIARGNSLVLVFGDDATIAAIRDLIGKAPSDNTMRIPLPAADVDMAVEVIDEYLDARAAGESGHAAGERLILDQHDPSLDAYAAWDLDTLRRFAANALAGTITLVDGDASRAEVGERAWAARGRRGTVSVYRVDYPAATDPALASETFAVVHDPDGELSPWLLFRIAGASYPVVRAPTEAAPSPAGGGSPMPLASGGDVPCGPTPCGDDPPSPSAAGPGATFRIFPESCPPEDGVYCL